MKRRVIPGLAAAIQIEADKYQRRPTGVEIVPQMGMEPCNGFMIFVPHGHLFPRCLEETTLIVLLPKLM